VIKKSDKREDRFGIKERTKIIWVMNRKNKKGKKRLVVNKNEVK